MIDLVFEGREKPTVHKFDPIKNLKGYSKPDGGLWMSPMTESGLSAWRLWCDHGGYAPTKHWHIVFNSDCRILSVDDDLANVRPYLRKSNLAGLHRVIDFEALSRDYDMIYASDTVVDRYSDTVFSGFDISSAILLNPTDKNGKPLFKALTDEEFQVYRQQYPSQETPASVPEIKEVDLARDATLKRWAMAMEGDLGYEEQQKAFLALLAGFSRLK